MMRSIWLWHPACLRCPLILKLVLVFLSSKCQPTQYTIDLSPKESIPPQHEPSIIKLRKAGRKFSGTLLNKPTNPRTSDLLRYRRQTRTPKSTGVHLLPLAAFSTWTTIWSNPCLPGTFQGYRLVQPHTVAPSSTANSMDASRHTLEKLNFQPDNHLNYLPHLPPPITGISLMY